MDTRARSKKFHLRQASWGYQQTRGLRSAVLEYWIPFVYIVEIGNRPIALGTGCH